MTGVRDHSTGELKWRGCNPVQPSVVQPRLRCCSHGRIDHEGHMTDLLQAAVDAHSGLSRWNHLCR
jgi:hypothetical protein